MKRWTVVLAFAIGVSLLACSPKLNTRSDEAFQSSLERIKKSLLDDERKQLEEDLMVLAFESVSSLSEFSSSSKSDIFKNLNGATAEDIHAKAEAVRERRREEERRQALQEIEELEKKKKSAIEAKKHIAKFEVQKARFQKERIGYMERPVISLTVVNNTKHPVARAFFKGTLSSPGRSIPWVKDDFNYSIPGGLEPSEKANWRLGLNRFSEWGSVDAPRDAVLSVEVVKLEGAEDKILFDAEFSDEDEKRLAELKKKYGGA